ncbi:MAG: CAP domain-containing protein [Deltaproteobacteria bacterium]|nr:CAP domain-containing protein [Deltaproteobacteria bacterium]
MLFALIRFLFAVALVLFLVSPSVAFADLADEIVAATNRERVSRGLNPLKTESALSQAAAKRAQELTRSFSHDRPNGREASSVFDEFGIDFQKFAENIYYDSYPRLNPAQAVKTWMGSSGHRQNILGADYTHIGVGVRRGDNGLNYAVQLFKKEWGDRNARPNRPRNNGGRSRSRGR